MGSRTALFSRKQAGGTFAIEDMARGTGARLFVHSGTGTNAVGGGQNPDAPLATLDYAIGLCAANKGDVIYLMAGHAETQSATGAMFTADVAGVKIIGLGTGADRPTLTFSHTGATSTVSANGVSIENVLFVTGIDSVTTFCTVSGADFALINCEGRDTTDIEVISDFTITGDRPTIKGYFKNGYTGGNANARVLSLNGVDRALIENCRFITKATTAVVNFVSNACTAINIRNSVFLVDSTTNLSKDVVDTVTGSTWSVDGCFDLGAGSGFSGGSGGALAVDDVAAVSTLVASVGTQTGSVGTQVGSVGTQAGSLGTQATSVGTLVTSVGTRINTADLLSTIVSAQTAIITACSNA